MTFKTQGERMPVQRKGYTMNGSHRGCAITEKQGEGVGGGRTASLVAPLALVAEGRVSVCVSTRVHTRMRVHTRVHTHLSPRYQMRGIERGPNFLHSEWRGVKHQRT